MPSDNELLFGKIAIAHGFCTKEQIERCVEVQSKSADRLPLGRILVDEGYLTEERHSKVCAIQRENMRARDSLAKRQREATLFGKLAVREGLLTEEKVNICLAEQAREGEKRTLGEIMVSKGYLTSAQVKTLLARQEKKIMYCPGCKLAFTVLTIAKGKQINCPRCHQQLQEGKPSDSTRTDAEFATQTLRAVKGEAPAESVVPSRVIPPGAVKMKLCCAVCRRPIEAFPDSTGRVRCPSCHATYVPK
jgi:mannitol/fructose-specific phosphotransferase system IIA component (Ntr-type)